MLPATLPVTIPDESTLAMAADPLDQVPGPGVPVRNIEEFSHTLLSPPIGLGSGLIVIGHEVWQPVDKP